MSAFDPKRTLRLNGYWSKIASKEERLHKVLVEILARRTKSNRGGTQ